MNTLCILLGGNLGEVSINFEKAISLIEKGIGKISKSSSIYKSEAWGFDSNSTFLNQVLIIDTILTAFPILRATQSIEKTIGRKTKSHNQIYSDRLIDIDILFYNNEVIDTERLKVPHPRLHLRNFTLAPLNEIIPEFNHPLLNKKIKYLHQNSEDKLVCTKISR